MEKKEVIAKLLKNGGMQVKDLKVYLNNNGLACL